MREDGERRTTVCSEWFSVDQHLRQRYVLCPCGLCAVQNLVHSGAGRTVVVLPSVRLDLDIVEDFQYTVNTQRHGMGAGAKALSELGAGRGGCFTAFVLWGSIYNGMLVRGRRQQRVAIAWQLRQDATTGMIA